ncbi:hypothetical protein ACFO4E_25700 [Nocardiopsis mangrovi]|uniref:Transcriptional regulator n=1 Tax=Nocardiopsis mangrovi TaxID=1179818 RepID=A0ABV9E3J9_9ACTN
MTLGDCRVDGCRVSNARAVELVVAVALAGGSAPRDWLISQLFEKDPAPSSLPTLAMRARNLGLGITYSADRHAYSLQSPVECDIIDLFDHVKTGDLAKALDLYRGPFMPRSHSPFATELRASAESLVADAVATNGDPVLLRTADRLIKHPAISRLIVSLGTDPIATALSRSWLLGL